MIYALFGPAGWATRLKRLMTDRTNVREADVLIFTQDWSGDNHNLRGVNDQIEVISCEGLMYELSAQQRDCLRFIDHINRSRRIEPSDDHRRYGTQLRQVDGSVPDEDVI